MLIHGRCHCGNLSFGLRWEPDPAAIPARACDCTFCTKHGAVWTAHPAAALQIDVERPDRVSRYRFGTRTADFWICTECGVVAVATSQIDDRLYAVVNVNTFTDTAAASLLQPAPVSFGAEDENHRLARRKRGWAAEVVCVERSA